MPKFTLAKSLKKYRNTCVLVDKICVQVRDNRQDSRSISGQLYIGRGSTPHGYVGKAWGKALILSPLTHSQTTAILRRLTDTIRQLPTLSTPPITTTTNIFN